MIIVKVRKQGAGKIANVPKNSGIEVGDYIFMQKIKEEKEEDFEEEEEEKPIKKSDDGTTRSIEGGREEGIYNPNRVM